MPGHYSREDFLFLQLNVITLVLHEISVYKQIYKYNNTVWILIYISKVFSVGRSSGLSVHILVWAFCKTGNGLGEAW